MKKTYLLIVTFFLICALITAQDWTRTEIDIAKLGDGQTIVIDGVPDELWDNHEQFVLEIEDDNSYGVLPSIYETWFKMAWTDSSLLMILYRDDDDFADRWETGLEDWQSDRDEIFFDVNVNNLADGKGASDSQGDGQGSDYGHYQFTSIWVQGETEWSGSPSQWYHNAPFTFAYVIDGDEYYTEYEFPYSSLTINTELEPGADETFQGAEGVTFGLVVTVSDVDMSENPTDQTFRKFMRFVDEGGWEGMDSAAYVTMVGPIEVSVEDATYSNIAVYPNPASDYIMINNISAPVDIEIRNVIGQLILTRKDVGSSTKIDISMLSKGIYFMNIDDNITVKFITR
ncbi:T9SS type A sorting domain-containing protein [Bacteroidota bacterium]